MKDDATIVGIPLANRTHVNGLVQTRCVGFSLPVEDSAYAKQRVYDAVNRRSVCVPWPPCFG